MSWTPAVPTSDGGVSAEHWYRADDAYEENTRITTCSDDGDVVGSWTDKTGNADHVSQGTAANKPLWKINIKNGKPALLFDGSNDYLQGAWTNGGQENQPNTFFAVAQLNALAVNDNTGRQLCNGDDTSHRCQLGVNASSSPDEWTMYAGVSLNGNGSNSNWIIWTALFNGASSQFWHNGVSEASGNAGSENPDGLTVGASPSGSSNWYGYIAEIIVFGSNLSDADKDEVAHYLSDYYDISYTDIWSGSPSSSPSPSPSATPSPSASESSSPSASPSPSASESSSPSASLSPSASESSSPSVSASASASASGSASLSPSASASASGSASPSPSSSESSSPSASPSASPSPSPVVIVPAQFADYNIWLCDWQGEKVSLLHTSGLSESDFVNIQWQKKLNDAGVYRMVIVAETDTKDSFRVDYGVLVERNYGAGFYEEYRGFHLDSEEWLESSDVDEHYWSSMGQSPEWILDQPLLQPLPNVGNPNWDKYDMWWFYGPADDAIKRMAAESCGSGVALPEADREFDYFIVEGDTGEGVVSAYEGRYVRLLDAMRDAIGEDGSKGGCDFRVVKVAGGYELRTYAPFYGTDRRRGHSVTPTVFSLDLENVLNPKRRVLRNAEVTVAIGGWQGGGMEQAIFEETNDPVLAESPWRRREEYYDLSQMSQSDTLSGYLQQKLIDEGKVEIVEFEPIQTAACLYGRDWNLGDLVTLDLWGNTYDMRITEVLGQIDGDSEETIQGRAELWTRADT